MTVMQHAVTQMGVMSVPATQDTMAVMDYLAEVYCNSCSPFQIDSPDTLIV